MVKRHDKGSDGKYHINGKTYPMLEGSRAQVMHGTAYKTPGGLTKSHLKMSRDSSYVRFGWRKITKNTR